jgi:hypothetical protein
MKKVLVWVGVVGLMAPLTGCLTKPKETPTTVMQEMTSLLNQTAAELSRVQDEGSADAARPKMQGVWKRYEELSRQLYTLVQAPGVQPPSTQEFRTAELQLRLAKKAVVAQWSRIANPKISPWGGAFATEFQPFADELAGDALTYEAPVRPAAVP